MFLQQLFKSYNNYDKKYPSKMIPISHGISSMDIEIILDDQGNFRRAYLLSPEERATIIPVTEKSRGARTSTAIEPHPICDQLQYVAEDYIKYTPKQLKEKEIKLFKNKFKAFQNLLQGWNNSSFSNYYIKAVTTYINKGTLINDLKTADIPIFKEDGKLLEKIKTEETRRFGIRWSIEKIGDSKSTVYNNKLMQESWINYEKSLIKDTNNGVCMVSGEHTRIAQNFFRVNRSEGKIISSNDKTNYVFRGRHKEPLLDISYEIVQKAQNMLDWLVINQSTKNQDQTIIVFSTGAYKPINIFSDSAALFENIEETAIVNKEELIIESSDFSNRLRKLLYGYKTTINDNDDIILLVLYQTGKGRKAILYNQKIKNTELIDRLYDWHNRYAWFQQTWRKNEKDKNIPLNYVGTMSVYDIATALYGPKNKQRSKVILHLVKSIFENTKISESIVNNIAKKSIKNIKNQKLLGMACSLFKGNHPERNYTMALDTNKNERDYLIGRLLAVYHNIEQFALDKKSNNKNKRETNVEKMFKACFNNPEKTLKYLELKLKPYKKYIKTQYYGFFVVTNKLVIEIWDKLNTYNLSKPLTIEALIGYNSQILDLYKSKETKNNN